MTEFTGRALDRVDGRLKVTGAALYAAEVAVANLAHAVIVGSAIAKGKIVGIDLAKAEALPGVLHIMTPKNAPKLKPRPSEPNERVVQLLQNDDILYDGQPVAVVIADTLEHARHAARSIDIEYREERAVFDLESERERAYAPKEIVGEQPDSNRGDVEQALTNAPVRVEQKYSTPIQVHNPMEMHSTLAVWQGPERLTVYDSTQGIFTVRKRLAALFELEPEKVRVISWFLGGGFGCKGSPWSHVGLTALAARIVGRPVKLMLTRQQMFAFVGYRPKTLQSIALAARKDGSLSALRHETLSETSRFDEFVEGSALASRMLYACPNVKTSHRVARLDIATPTFTRAPGMASGVFALECALDELSYALKMDPLALRLKNYAEKDPHSGKPWTSKSLRTCYQRAAERFGWYRRKPEPRSMSDGHTLIGWGMSTAVYPARLSPASAEARMRQDGSVLVRAGSQDLGTGTYTIMTQVAADAVGVPVNRVRFELGDTTFPEAPLSAGSRTAASVGSAVKLASLSLRQKLAALATKDAKSPLHGLPLTEIDAGDGALFHKADPKRRDPYAELLQRAGQTELSATADAKEKPERSNFSAYAFGAQFAEVRVDRELGQIRVSRMVGAFASGKILNAKTALSQFLGGMVWAIGFALHEHGERDPRNGRMVTKDLVDYHVPVNADVPNIEVIMVDEVDRHVSEVGAKGAGEIGITGGAAAIANAVYHATGKRLRDLPMTLDQLLDVV